jgi:DDE superfamily endonuclease
MVPCREGVVEAREDAFSAGCVWLRRLRARMYECFSRRADALFELGDALLCAAGPVLSPVELSLEPEFRRGHGSVYDALAGGRVDGARLRRVLTGVVAPARAGEPLMFGVDVSPIARPDARYVDQLSMVQVRGAGGDRFVSGWPVSFVVGIGWGVSSWVDPVDACRVVPGRGHTQVLIEQVDALLGDLKATGRWRVGDPAPLVMFDAGYPGAVVAHAFAGRAVQLLGRVRADRVFYAEPGAKKARGRTPRHGARFACADPATHPVADVRIVGRGERYGRIEVRAWHGLHQALDRSGEWAGFPAGRDLPVLPGTLIRIEVEKLPHDGRPKPVWLWHAAAPGTPPDVDLLWKAYLRRFDQEHFHRFAKVHLGLDNARLLSADAVDRWIAVVMAGYAQLRQAAALVVDQPKPWQKKTAPDAIPTPCRVRAGFRRLRAVLGTPAGAAKTTRPGPGRPPGRGNRPKAQQPVYRKSDNPPAKAGKPAPAPT